MEFGEIYHFAEIGKWKFTHALFFSTNTCICAKWPKPFTKPLPTWMHPVLHLQPNRPRAQPHQPLKQRLVQSALRRLLAHNNWPQLTMIPHQHHLLRSHCDRDQALRLRRLRRLIDQNVLEAHVEESVVAGSDVGAADDIGVFEKIAFALGPEGTEAFFIFEGEFTAGAGAEIS